MDASPWEDLKTVEDPEVDVAALQTQIAAAAGPLSGGLQAPWDISSSPPRVAGPHRSTVADGADIVPYTELPSHRVGTPVKRLLRRALRWYLWPVTAAMSGHNLAVSSVLAENRRQLERVRLEHERLQRDLDVLPR